MKVEIVGLGKVRDKHCRALVDEYVGRLRHYTTIEHTELREVRVTRTPAEALSEEADKLRRRCGPDTVRIAMDERGELLTSVQLAQRIEGWRDRGTRHIAFFLGSAYGLDPEFVGECEHRLALSPMTLPHELARVMLAEQLYRAMTILRGEPYHK